MKLKLDIGIAYALIESGCNAEEGIRGCCNGYVDRSRLVFRCYRALFPRLSLKFRVYA